MSKNSYPNQQPVTGGCNPTSEVTFRAKNLLGKTKPKTN